MESGVCSVNKVIFRVGGYFGVDIYLWREVPTPLIFFINRMLRWLWCKGSCGIRKAGMGNLMLEGPTVISFAGAFDIGV